MYLPLISFLTELWHLLDVSAVAGHGAVLAALLLLIVNVCKSSGRVANSVDPDQRCLLWVYNVCLGMSFRICRAVNEINSFLQTVYDNGTIVLQKQFNIKLIRIRN